MLVACGEEEALDERPENYTNGKWQVYAVHNQDTLANYLVEVQGGGSQSARNGLNANSSFTSQGSLLNPGSNGLPEVGGISFLLWYSDEFYEEDSFWPEGMPTDFYLRSCEEGDNSCWDGNPGDQYTLNDMYYRFFGSFANDPFVTVGDSVKVHLSAAGPIHELVGYEERKYLYQDYNASFEYQAIDTADANNRILDISIYVDLKMYRQNSWYQ